MKISHKLKLILVSTILFSYDLTCKFIIFLIFYFTKEQIVKKNILIIRPDHIGDFILWIGSIKSIRTLYPKDLYNIILVGNTTWIELSKKINLFDSIIGLDVRKFNRSPIYRFIKHILIYKLNSYIVINPVYSREFNCGDSIVRMSRGVYRIGFNGDSSNMPRCIRSFSNLSYTSLIDIDNLNKSEIQINSEFMSALGLNSVPTLATLPFSSIHFPDNLQNIEYYIIIPGGSWEGKRWPIDNFQKLINKINKKYKIYGIICGSKDEWEIGNLINAGLEVPIINMCGRLSLVELVEYIRRSKVLISNDTGPAHIGAAVKTPTVCFLGGGHYGRFFPYTGLSEETSLYVLNTPMECYNCNWNCRYTTNKNQIIPCISSIEVEDAMNIVCSILNK